MTIDELLNELENYPRPHIQSEEGAIAAAATLMRAAALTIRQLKIAEKQDKEERKESTWNA